MIRLYPIVPTRTLVFALVSLILLTACGTKPFGPVAVYRNRSGMIDLVLNPTPIRYFDDSVFKGDRFSDEGIFDGSPDVARLPNGDCIVAARDTSNGLWVDLWRQSTRKWMGWHKTDLVTTSDPMIALLGPSGVLVTLRDSNGGYWMLTVDDDLKFGKKANLGGVFQSDPSASSCPDGSVLIAGIDRSHVLWSAIATRDGDFKRPWTASGAVLDGEISALCGSGGPRVVARDTYSTVGVVQLSAAGKASWSNGGLRIKSDPACAVHGDSVYIAVLDDAGRLQFNRFRDTGSGVWGSWKYLGDSVLSAAPAIWDDQVTVFIHPQDNTLQWWRPSATSWQAVVWGSFVRGRVRAAPR